MVNASPTAIAFTGLVLLVALLIVHALRRAALGSAALVGVLLAYLAVPGVLAWSGALDRYDPLPAPALVIVLALTILTVVVVLSPLGGRLAATIPLASVVALQAFRIFVELLLHRLYVEGAVPEHMTYSGRNLDVVTGITGLALGAWLWSGRGSRRLVWAWNVLGLLLLANIVVIAVLSTPVRFRLFTQAPPHVLPSTFPYVWLPSFLVQVALGSHLLVFRQVRGNARQPARGRTARDGDERDEATPRGARGHRARPLSSATWTTPTTSPAGSRTLAPGRWRWWRAGHPANGSVRASRS